MNKPQLVICGSIAIDRIMNFSGRYRDLIQPDKLHVLSISTLLDTLEDSPGGTGANIAYCLAKLGEEPLLIGSVGHDAETYIKKLDQAGVDTSGVHFSDLPTASFNVFTDSEDSQVGGFYQGAMADSEQVSFSPWAHKDVLAVVAVHNPEAMNRQVQECRRAGLRLVYDPGQQIANDSVDLAAGVDTAELLFVNDYEQSLMRRRLNREPEQLKKQVPIIVTTLGKEGSIIEGTGLPEPIRIGIAKPDAVKDPTGAGDGYRAGFLYGYLRQWELKACGQLGAVVASFIVERHGTQVPFEKADVIKRYRDNFNEEIEL